MFIGYSSFNSQVNILHPLALLICTLVDCFIFLRSKDMVRYIILLSFHGGGVAWENTGVNIFPNTPPVCRHRHCSWCFIVHRKLLGDTATSFIPTMRLPSSLSRGNSLTVAARQGPARSGPVRRVVARRHLLATCKAGTPSPIPTTPLWFTSSQGFFKVDITSFRKRDLRHVQFWFTSSSLSPFMVCQKESFEKE